MYSDSTCTAPSNFQETDNQLIHFVLERFQYKQETKVLFCTHLLFFKNFESKCTAKSNIQSIAALQSTFFLYMLLCYKTSTSKEQIQKGFKAILSTFSLSNKIFFKSLRVHFNVTKRIIFFQSQFSRKYSKHFLRLKPLLIPNSTWLWCLYPLILL